MDGILKQIELAENEALSLKESAMERAQAILLIAEKESSKIAKESEQEAKEYRENAMYTATLEGQNIYNQIIEKATSSAVTYANNIIENNIKNEVASVVRRVIE